MNQYLKNADDAGDLGYDHITTAYKTDPAESKQKIIEHLGKLLPDATEKQILKIIKA